LRQVSERLATPRDAFVGSAETVADRLQQWFESGAADGFVIFEPLPGQLDLFVDRVIPILQARDLCRTNDEGSTFREHLGLPEPDNRYSAALSAENGYGHSATAFELL
jgi:hypothetical protein